MSDTTAVPTPDLEEVQEALKKVFAYNEAIYHERGFLKKRIGPGAWPAILVIDLAHAWTEPGYSLSCDNMEEVIDNTNRLLAVGREKGVPIVFTTMGYRVVEGHNSDSGIEQLKSPIHELKIGNREIEIDERLGMREDEQFIMKKYASGFAGTNLASFLTAAGVDTVIVTGVTASACVRATTVDAFSAGFRPIVPRECVSDRIAGAVEWNLFDIDAKFGDVESLDSVERYLQGLPVRRPQA
ncbi:isochorismatase family protein [Patulibacter defluvii]|uniref:isochorismatase family protein n=1 Tax=Patulibacter defluvii TaxID=3095358 RepID=UPI002A75C6E5|nr:isochorismatase family protein [Patulibacter sp. DM4]